MLPDVATNAQTTSVQTRSDIANTDRAQIAFWLQQESLADKDFKKWVEKGRKIVRRYRDERAATPPINEAHRFNILWSNVETLKPALYSKSPKADVERRYKDQDDIGRLASEILERATNFTLETTDIDMVMKQAVEDRLLPGRGQVRVLYIPHFGAPLDDVGEEEGLEAEGEMGEDIVNRGDAGPDDTEIEDPIDGVPGQETERELVYEEVKLDYVFWEDYLEAPARQERDIAWKRYRSYLTYDELKARFGKSIADKINLDYTPSGVDEKDKDALPPDALKKAIVHETWDKSKKQVLWWGPGTPDLIFDRVDDPLKLPGFYPSPRALFATMTNETRIPVPDFVEYQDQAQELDILTARIDILVRALKVSGVYAGSEKQALQQLLDSGTENKLIAVEDWAAFSGDKGGLKGVIEWLPIQQVAETLIQLYNARDRSKQILYEVTGMSDIIRGATNPEETFGAQKIKSQWVTMRLSESQKEVARFARDSIRLIAYLIATHFSPETLSQITSFPQLLPVPPVPQGAAMLTDVTTGQQVPNPAMQQYIQMYQPLFAENAKRRQDFEQAVELLKQDAEHDFRIDIESDTVIAGDEEAEKQARIEFLGQFIPLMQTLMPIAQGQPALASLASEMALFGVRSFKAARPLEDAIEAAFKQLSQMPPAPPKGAQGHAQAPENPQLEMAKEQSETQRNGQDNQSKEKIALIDANQRQHAADQTFQLEAAKLNEQHRFNNAKLMLQASKQDEQRTFRQAEMLGMTERAAEGLT